MLDVAIVLGSTRPGRNGEAVSRWIKVRDIMRKAIAVKRGTKLKDIVASFKKYEEIVVEEGGKESH